MAILCVECDGVKEICVAILVVEISMISGIDESGVDGSSKSDWTHIRSMVVCIVKVVWNTLFD